MEGKEQFLKWIRKILKIPINVAVIADYKKVATLNDVPNFYEDKINLLEYIEDKLKDVKMLPNDIKTLMKSKIKFPVKDEELISEYIKALKKSWDYKDIVLAGKLIKAYSVLIYHPEHYFLIL